MNLLIDKRSLPSHPESTQVVVKNISEGALPLGSEVPSADELTASSAVRGESSKVVDGRA